MSPTTVLKGPTSAYLDGLAVDLVGPSSVVPKCVDGTCDIDILGHPKNFALVPMSDHQALRVIGACDGPVFKVSRAVNISAFFSIKSASFPSARPRSRPAVFNPHFVLNAYNRRRLLAFRTRVTPGNRRQLVNVILPNITNSSQVVDCYTPASRLERLCPRQPCFLQQPS